MDKSVTPATHHLNDLRQYHYDYNNVTAVFTLLYYLPTIIGLSTYAYIGNRVAQANQLAIAPTYAGSLLFFLANAALYKALKYERPQKMVSRFFRLAPDYDIDLDPSIQRWLADKTKHSTMLTLAHRNFDQFSPSSAQTLPLLNGLASYIIAMVVGGNLLKIALAPLAFATTIGIYQAWCNMTLSRAIRLERAKNYEYDSDSEAFLV